MSISKKRLIVMLAVSAALAVIISPALAQDEVAAETSTNMSYFSRFFMAGDAIGTAMIWFIILMSMAMVSLVIQAAIQHRAVVYMPPALMAEVERLLNEKNYKEAIRVVSEDQSVFGQTMFAVLSQASRGYAAMEQALYETAETLGGQRVRSLVWIELNGSAGPMVGLFGTVYGMIMAFSQLVASGGAPKPAELAGGIATALVTTFWGLVVGIPGVVAGSLFRVKIEGLTTEVIVTGAKLLERFRPGTTAKKPAATTVPLPNAKLAESAT